MPYYSAILSAVFLAPACGVLGALAKKVRLPSITGFLLAGVLAGPHVLNLLTEESLPQLWFIDQICLSVIALAAGAELRWETLERTQRQVISSRLQCHLDHL
jgi:Kef-type K+ transport system membrane component KefB